MKQAKADAFEALRRKVSATVKTSETPDELSLRREVMRGLREVVARRTTGPWEMKDRLVDVRKATSR